jgi:hypothetical protein
MTPVLTLKVKAHVERTLPPGHPGREAVMALPDQMDEAAYDAAFPILLRLLRLRGAEEEVRP